MSILGNVPFSVHSTFYCFTGIWLYDPECVNSEYEQELNISIMTSGSVCFQQLTIYFEHDDDSHNCSCSVTQVTAELNHLQYLIENHCSNASVNNYTVYVETDDGTESNSLNVTCSARTIYSGDNIMTTTSQTSNQSKVMHAVSYYQNSYYTCNHFFLGTTITTSSYTLIIITGSSGLGMYIHD